MISAQAASWFAASIVICLPRLGFAAEREQGIPVAESSVIDKCGGCHARDALGNMQRLSWARATPEGWQSVLKQMILLYDLSITPADARSIVKYLSASHGLAPSEAAPVMYEPERRIQEEQWIPSDGLRDACAKCHTMALALSWRRSAEDWKDFVEKHAARYKIPTTTEAIQFLADTAGLHSTSWETWSSRRQPQDLSGRWLLSAHVPGRGDYYGEIRIEADGGDEYRTNATLTSVRDGTRTTRSGRATVFGGVAWRGRSKGQAPTSSSPGDLSSEAREVLLFEPDRAIAHGRWFWGQYDEFGFDVKLQRASVDPAIIGVNPSSLKTGSRANRLRIAGDNLPLKLRSTDLNLGRGVTVRRIVSASPAEVIAEVDVSSAAGLGKRDVTLRGKPLTGAITIYDRVDYIKVTPESSVAAFGDRTHAKGYQQFEAIAYQRGPDGRAHTAGDLALDPVEAAWSLEVFHAERNAEDVGTMNPLGLFIPADRNPNANFDTWAVATAKDGKDTNGMPLVAKSYLVVTIPTYTFNGRRYVRELGRWVDDGPAQAAAGHD